jgi:hypothetical protein
MIESSSSSSSEDESEAGTDNNVSPEAQAEAEEEINAQVDQVNIISETLQKEQADLNMLSAAAAADVQSLAGTHENAVHVSVCSLRCLCAWSLCVNE